MNGNTSSQNCRLAGSHENPFDFDLWAPYFEKNAANINMHLEKHIVLQINEPTSPWEIDFSYLFIFQ